MSRRSLADVGNLRSEKDDDDQDRDENELRLQRNSNSPGKGQGQSASPRLPAVSPTALRSSLDLTIKSQVKQKKAKKSFLVESGLAEAYDHIQRQLCKDGLPTCNIFEYAAREILQFEKERNKKKAMAHLKRPIIVPRGASPLGQSQISAALEKEKNLPPPKKNAAQPAADELKAAKSPTKKKDLGKKTQPDEEDNKLNDQKGEGKLAGKPKDDKNKENQEDKKNKKKEELKDNKKGQKDQPKQPADEADKKPSATVATPSTKKK